MPAIIRKIVFRLGTHQMNGLPLFRVEYQLTWQIRALSSQVSQIKNPPCDDHVHRQGWSQSFGTFEL